MQRQQALARKSMGSVLDSEHWEKILGRLPEKDELPVFRFLIESATKTHWIRSMILFGSRARGDHKLRSDFDIVLCVSQHTSSEDWNSFCFFVDENFPTLHSVDLIRYDALPPGLLESVKKEGKEIYHGTAKELFEKS